MTATTTDIDALDAADRAAEAEAEKAKSKAKDKRKKS